MRSKIPELSKIKSPFAIIRMSEFKVSGTYICTTSHYTHYYNDYNILYSNTLFYVLTWGYNAAKKQKNKTKLNKSNNPKIKSEL